MEYVWGLLGVLTLLRTKEREMKIEHFGVNSSRTLHLSHSLWFWSPCMGPRDVNPSDAHKTRTKDGICTGPTWHIHPFEVPKNANTKSNCWHIVREHCCCTYRTRCGFGRYAWVLGMLNLLQRPKEREYKNRLCVGILGALTLLRPPKKSRMKYRVCMGPRHVNPFATALKKTRIKKIEHVRRYRPSGVSAQRSEKEYHRAPRVSRSS